MVPDETEIGANIPSGPTALYRFYAEDGSLLYVGVSDDLRRRLTNHGREKPWWPAVARKTVTWYEDRDAAELAEAEAIDSEHPVHNVQTHSALLGKNAHVQRQALKVDVPVDLHLRHRMHQYRLDRGVDLRDQLAVAVDQWLRNRGY